MKKIDRYINKIPITAGIILLLLTIPGLTSCLKNSKNNIDFSTVGASVDLPLAAANNNSVVFLSYTAVPSANIPFYINLASPHTLGAAVTATFALDTAYLNNYNAANSTNYLLIPDSDYTVLNGWNRTIPAGQRLDSMYVKFDFTKMDPSQIYVLPVTIQTASVPIEQWNHLLISPKIKNQYDGNYTVTGYFVHPTSPRAISQTKTLTTISAIRLEGNVGDLGSFFQFDVVADSLTNWMSDVNSLSGFINGTDNAFGDPNYPASPPGPWLSGTYNNTYDPINHIFWMHYGYNGSPYSREIYEKWVLQ